MSEGNETTVSSDAVVNEVRHDEPVAEAKETVEEKQAKSYDENYVKALREEAAKHRTDKQAEKARVEKLEKELKAFQDAQLSEEERRAQELEELRSSSTTNLTRAQDAELKYQIALNAGKAEIQDVKAAIKLIERDSLEFDDRGNITNLEDTLAALKEEHPWLIGKAAPVAPSTGTTNPPKQTSASDRKYTRAELKGMSPEKINALYDEGRVKF